MILMIFYIAHQHLYNIFPILFICQVKIERQEYAPLDQIVLETDSPYLSPEPNRGKRNDSRNLVYVAREIARIKGVTEDEVIAVTEGNAERLLLR